MKIHLNKFIITIVAFLAFTNVDAATIKVNNGTYTDNTTNRTVTLELSGDDLDKYTKVEFALSSGEDNAKPAIQSPNTGAITSYGVVSSIGGYYFENTNGLQSGTLATVSYDIGNNIIREFQIMPVEVSFYNSTGEKFTVQDGIKVESGTVKYEEPKSNDASLTDLSVSQGTLSPEFDPEKLEYEVTVSDKITTIRINATAADGASRTGTGNQSLEMGENTFKVEVTAEDGTTKKTYIVRINRGEVSNPSAYLKSLTINNIGVKMSPEFDSKNNKYTASIPKDITKLDIKYELEDKAAKVEIEGNEKLVPGENKITIKVTASDESDKQTYEIIATVTEEEPSPTVETEKPQEKKKMSIWVIVGIVAGILAIIIGVAIALFKKKKKRPTPPNTPTEISPAPRHAENINDDEASVTDVLKKELFDEIEKTNIYDRESFKDAIKTAEDYDKTKEYNFKNLN